MSTDTPQPPTPEPTPRTEKEYCRRYDGDFVLFNGNKVIKAEFAETLERETVQLRQQLESAQAELAMRDLRECGCRWNSHAAEKSPRVECDHHKAIREERAQLRSANEEKDRTITGLRDEVWAHKLANMERADFSRATEKALERKASELRAQLSSLTAERDALLKELGWHANTLSVFSANIPNDAEHDRRFVEGRLAEAEKLGAKLASGYAKIRPFEPLPFITALQARADLGDRAVAALAPLADLADAYDADLISRGCQIPPLHEGDDSSVAIPEKFLEKYLKSRSPHPSYLTMRDACRARAILAEAAHRKVNSQQTEGTQP